MKISNLHKLPFEVIYHSKRILENSKHTTRRLKSVIVENFSITQSFVFSEYFFTENLVNNVYVGK